MTDPYRCCPVLETPHFTLRLVAESDAGDLLACYSDPKARALFNGENCTSDFCYDTPEEMAACIRFWLEEYAQRKYVRFAVVDRGTGRAVGTVEMFGDKGLLAGRDGGLLRIDLASPYETPGCLGELLSLAGEHFYRLFGVSRIATQGLPGAEARLAALRAAGYVPFDWPAPGRQHYFIQCVPVNAN